MQTIKTTLLTLISVAVLSACGLKGPLYLADEDTAAKPVVEQDSSLDIDEKQDKEEDKEKDSDPG